MNKSPAPVKSAKDRARLAATVDCHGFDWIVRPKMTNKTINAESHIDRSVFVPIVAALTNRVEPSVSDTDLDFVNEE
jgi:hypothetical protein